MRGQQQPRGVAIDVEILVIRILANRILTAEQTHQRQRDGNYAAHADNCVTACHMDTGGEAGPRTFGPQRDCIYLKKKDVTLGKERASPYRELMEYL